MYDSWEDFKYNPTELKFYDKDKYHGQIANNKWHGKGIYNWSNGDMYKGDFKNGQLSGKGVFYYR
jgi:hypothetical protein